MENTSFQNPEKKFSSPQEELQYLREQVLLKEKQLVETGQKVEHEKIINDSLVEYHNKPVEHVLEKSYEVKPAEHQEIVLDLSPEAHDEKMGQLIGLLNEKGLKNTMNTLEGLKDPHLYDDFHRFLVQYVKAGFEVKGLSSKGAIFRALHITLFEVTLPGVAAEHEKGKKISEIISGMEQFYAGMISVYDSSEKSAGYFSLELANPNGSDELLFYIAVPDDRIQLFEKQIISIFPDVKVVEKKDDYNIFNIDGQTAASYANLKENPIYPIRTYDSFDKDPLSVLLNVFSKISKEGEGASVQLVFKPVGDFHNRTFSKSLEQINKGVPLKEAIDTNLSFGHILSKVLVKTAKDTAKDLMFPDKDKDKKDEPRADDLALQNIKNKIASNIVETNLRLVVSGPTQERAEAVLSDLESAFNQFDNTTGNRLKFTKTKKNELAEVLHDFSFRNFSENYRMPLNLREVTSLFHFPNSGLVSAPNLKEAKSGSAPAPIEIGQAGILLGVNRYRGAEKKIYFTPEDRLRHFYTIGQTGTGKTTLLKNMIAQDIANGDGVCFIDPHGSDILDVLSYVPPERYEDIIYFDPSYTDRPMALNMLEYDVRFPEQKTFVVNEMLSIFNKLFDMKTAGGPMFEQYFRNATMLVIEDPETGNTLLDVSRVMSNKAFRDLKLSRCRNPIVVQFWREVAEKAGGEASLANIVPYIVSKFDVFLSNEIMRPIIAQEKSSFNFREIMDNKKILLVNLSKGRLGDMNANLIGLIFVGKILMAALSRVDAFGSNLPPFYLYIDEFQNVTTDSISTILSEARKYKLGLNIAHQFIAQLEDKIKDSVFGNVGSISAFRVGAEDAEYLEKQFSPVFTAKDIMNIDNRNAYLKMLGNGKPLKPFNIETLAPPKGNKEIVPKLKELSYLKYGEDRAEVESKIMEKYKK